MPFTWTDDMGPVLSDPALDAAVRVATTAAIGLLEAHRQAHRQRVPPRTGSGRELIDAIQAPMAALTATDRGRLTTLVLQLAGAWQESGQSAVAAMVGRAQATRQKISEAGR